MAGSSATVAPACVGHPPLLTEYLHILAAAGILPTATFYYCDSTTDNCEPINNRDVTDWPIVRDRLATPGAGRRTRPPAARPQDQDVHAPNPSVGNPDTDLCVRFYLEPDSGFLLFIRVSFLCYVQDFRNSILLDYLIHTRTRIWNYYPPLVLWTMDLSWSIS